MLLQLSFQQCIRLKVLAAVLKLESISCWSGSFLCVQWHASLPTAEIIDWLGWICCALWYSCSASYANSKVHISKNNKRKEDGKKQLATVATVPLA